MHLYITLSLQQTLQQRNPSRSDSILKSNSFHKNEEIQSGKQWQPFQYGKQELTC